MDTFWTAAGGWWVQAAVSGGAVLLLGWVGTLVFRRPAVRQKIAAWAVRGAVLAAVLSALPHWVLLPRPSWLPGPEQEVAVVEPSPPEGAEQVETPPPPAVVDAAEPEPEGWVFIPWEALRGEVPVDELPLPEKTSFEPAPPANAPLTPAAPEATDTPPSPAGSVVPLLLSAYAVVAGVLLLQLLWERLALTWLLRDAAPLVSRARWVWDRLTVDERGYRAVTSTRLRTPLCVGFFRPLVILPKRLADTADADTLRWVLAHELDHVRRGDTRTAHWVGVARAVFFFVPWFWALRRDLNLCQEFLADAAAAGHGANPADYAAFLVDLSGGRTSRRPIAAARMKAGKSDLFRRVNMLLNVKTAARGVSRGFAAVAGTAAIAAAVALSGLGFADEPRKDVLKVAPKPIIETVIERLPGGEDIDVDVKVIVDGQEVKPVIRMREEKAKQGKAAVKDEVIKLIKEGKVDEAKELLEQLAKADVVKPKVDVVKPVVVPVDVVREVVPRVARLQPPADVVKQAPRVVVGSDNDLRAQYERQLKEFEESIKKATDAEAKEQLEKARDEYKKAMEEPLKKADAARKELDTARQKMEQAERANRGANDAALKRLMEMQKDMEKRLFDDLKKFEGFKGLEGQLFNPEDLKKLEGLGFGGQGGFVVGPDGLFVPGGARNTAQPRLGVKIEKMSAVLAEQLDLPKDSGVVIADVTADSPAAKAGLKKNDVLLKLADKDVPTDPTAFTEMVGKLKAGEKITAVVLRKGKKETVKGIELSEPKKPARGGDFGDLGRLGGRLQVGPGGANESVQIQINDDDVSLQATVDGVGYTVTGTAENGKLVPGKIVIKEGKESNEYESLDKVPEGQRATVERLIGKVRVVGK